MIYFGTGKYFEKDDDTSTALQTIYAIWDKTQSNDDISYASTDTLAEKRNVLQEHKIIFEGDNPFDATGQTKIRITDDVGAVPYSGGGAKRGWFMNLVVGTQLLGERVVSAPILRNRRIIFTTIVPNGSPCEFGGTSWIMEFDPMSGNRLSESVFDLNGDGEFTSADYVEIVIDGETVRVPANGVRSDEGMIKSPAIISGGGKEYKVSSGTTGNVLVVAEKGAANRARASWRQIR
jgi:type IV pilus assembly protein PilY1